MHDIRDAVRSLRATPVVSLVAILSLALGIGANTAIFSILDSLLLRSLPVREPQALALLGSGDGTPRVWTHPIWEQVRERASLFDGAFAWAGTRFNLARGGQTEPVAGLWASGRMFETLGVQALLGRTFTDADDRRGGGPDGPVAVISHGFWQRRFDGAADVIGRSLTVEGVPFTIVGVTPPHFFGVDVGRTFDVAIPIGTEPLIAGQESRLDRRGSWWLSVMVRLKADQTLERGDAALRGVQAQIRDATVPTHWRPQDQLRYLADGLALAPAATGGSSLREYYRRPLTAIMVVVALVLLIACANIANLLLARATMRRRELSIRVALGASRLRIARQLLAESLLLSALGALLGLLLAQWGSDLLVRQLSTSTAPVFLAMPLDWRVLGFTTMVAVVTTMLFGMAPALRGMRVQPNDALKANGRGIAGDAPIGMSGFGTGRLGIGRLARGLDRIGLGRVGLASIQLPRIDLGGALVVLQVALSLVLVVAAGLFVRTFASLATLDLGFDRASVLVAHVNAVPARLEPDARLDLFRRTLDAAVAVPGVASAALSQLTPISGSDSTHTIDLPDGPPLPERERTVYFNRLSPGWFRTYGTPLLAGRDFTSADTSRAPQVAIVNEAFARRFAGDRNPIGLRFRQPGTDSRPTVERQIVGYVKDAVYRSAREPVPPTVYIPYTQNHEAYASMALSVRAAAGSPALLARPLAAALTQVHGDIAIAFRPLADQVDAALVQERIVAWLSAFFGGLALLLAGLGLYGVTSYAVSRRRAEIGIRLALGAAPAGVVVMVLRRVALLVGAGTIAGAAISLWASRFVATLLYGLPPGDPLTLIGAIVVLAAIGAMAGWLPARRAARIDPARVLRDG